MAEKNTLHYILEVIFYPSTTHPTYFPTNRKFSIEFPAYQTQWPFIIQSIRFFAWRFITFRVKQICLPWSWVLLIRSWINQALLPVSKMSVVKENRSPQMTSNCNAFHITEYSYTIFRPLWVTIWSQLHVTNMHAKCMLMLWSNWFIRIAKMNGCCTLCLVYNGCASELLSEMYISSILSRTDRKRLLGHTTYLSLTLNGSCDL